MEGGKEEEGRRKGKERGKRPCALTRDDRNPWDSEWQPASEGATVLVSNFPSQMTFPNLRCSYRGRVFTVKALH